MKPQPIADGNKAASSNVDLPPMSISHAPRASLVHTSLGGSATGLAILLVVTTLGLGCDRKPDGPAPSVSVSGSTAIVAPPSVASSGASGKASIDAGVHSARVEIDEVRIKKAGPTTVHVTWKIPPGTDLNDGAPFRVRWNRSDGLAEPPADVTSSGSHVKEGFDVKVTPMTGAPNMTLGGDISIVVCDSATHVVCVPVKRSLELGFVAVNDADPIAKVTVPLPEARPQ